MITIIDHYSQAPGEKGNNRFIYLAKLLSEHGYQVEVVTTDFSHIKKQTRNIPQEEIEKLPFGYVMLHEPVYKKNICLQRIISHRIFGRNLARYLKNRTDIDCIYASVPSLDVGATAGNYCSKHHIPFIIDIQDLWPEAFKLVMKLPGISDIAFLPMTLQANKFYRQADRIIAVSETYKQRGLRSNQKDKSGLCVYLGTDLDRFDENSKSKVIEKTDDELWIAYVGTLGHSYNIEIILDALNLIADRLDKKVVFHVLGDGPYLERFKEYAKKCKIKTVFHGRLDYPSMTAYLCKSDIAVNPIVKGAAQSIINKHADYAAAGLPVVNTQECEEYRNLISQYRCGINCDVESVEEVANALKELIENPEKRKQMGANSRRMAEELFDRRNTYQQIVRAVEDLAR